MERQAAPLEPNNQDRTKDATRHHCRRPGHGPGALAALLEIEGDISVVARARNGKEALHAVLMHKPDVFITDIEMPEMTGLDVAAELKRRKIARA